jgi:hypothetical protein
MNDVHTIVPADLHGTPWFTALQLMMANYRDAAWFESAVPSLIPEHLRCKPWARRIVFASKHGTNVRCDNSVIRDRVAHRKIELRKLLRCDPRKDDEYYAHVEEIAKVVSHISTCGPNGATPRMTEIKMRAAGVCFKAYPEDFQTNGVPPFSEASKLAAEWYLIHGLIDTLIKQQEYSKRGTPCKRPETSEEKATRVAENQAMMHAMKNTKPLNKRGVTTPPADPAGEAPPMTLETKAKLDAYHAAETAKHRAELDARAEVRRQAAVAAAARKPKTYTKPGASGPVRVGHIYDPPMPLDKRAREKVRKHNSIQAANAHVQAIKEGEAQRVLEQDKLLEMRRKGYAINRE